MSFRIIEHSLAFFGTSVFVATSLVTVPDTASARTIADLGTLPGNVGTTAMDINESGTVVGFSIIAGVGTRAVRWDNGVVRDLGTLPGFRNSVARAVNDADEVVGLSDTTVEDVRAVRWSNTGEITELLPLPGHENAHIGIGNINNAGIVVGSSRSIMPAGGLPFEEHAVWWDAAGKPTALPELPGTISSQAVQINNKGVIVGQARIAGLGWRAMRWDPDCTVTNLGVLPGATSSNVTALSFFGERIINEAGEIIGRCGGAPSSNGGVQAVKWTPDGTIIALPRVPGGTWNEAVDINESGVVIGQSGSAARSHPVRWSPDGTITELPTLPGHDRAVPNDINDAGVIVGTSKLTGDSRSARGVRWDPDGTITDLGVLPGGRTSAAFRITSNGMILGSASAPVTDEGRVVIWR